MVRTLRSECTVPPEKKIRLEVRVHDENRCRFLAENAALVKLLAGIGEMEVKSGVSDGGKKPASSIGLAGTGFEAFVSLAEAVDIELLKQKFTKELERDMKFIQGLKAKLANGDFLKNAPPELVEGEKRKLDEAAARTSKIQSWLKEMELP